MIHAPSIALALASTLRPAAAPVAPQSHPFAAPEALAAPAAGLSGLAEVTLALGLVLASIFALAWLVRRVRGLEARGAAALDVLGEVRLGTKERAVLIRVGPTQLLVGVAPGRVNTLHVLAEPVEAVQASGPPAERGARPSFRELLLRSLGKS